MKNLCIKSDIFKLIAFVLAVLIVGLQLISCTPSVKKEGSREESGMAERLSKDVTGDKVQASSVDAAFEKVYGEFAFNIFKRTLSDEKDNSMISPLSVMIALAMTANGSAGTTRAKFEEMFGVTVEQLNMYVYSYLQTLTSDDKAKLSLADSLWISDEENLEVAQRFLTDNAAYYSADIYKCDFQNEKTPSEVNAWVSEKTDGMIKKLVDKFDENAVMVLLNAIIFDAKWSVPYMDFSVEKGTFNSYDGKKESVDMMFSSESTYLKTDNAEGFVKYYEGKYAYAAFLPDKSIDVYDFIKDFSYDDYKDAFDNSESKDLRIRLPKYSYDYDAELNGALRDMGIGEAFDINKADFSGMITSRDDVAISRVIHKTRIEVTQQGTRAAAVTMVEMVCGSAYIPEPPKTITLDRPFVFFIIDTETDLPLFMGTVTNI